MPRLRAPSKEDSLLLPAYVPLPDRAIHIPGNPAEFDAARRALLAVSALGFDTESKPLFQVNQVDTGPHVVQLATVDAAWLLQLHHPEALELAREVVSNPAICKVGFGLDNDKSSLPRRLGVQLANVVDLDKVFSRHGYGPSTGVRAAVALVLGQNFHKSKKTSTSNWSLPQLSAGQVRYAANDAHAPALVYAALPDWERRQPAEPQARTRTARPGAERSSAARPNAARPRSDRPRSDRPRSRPGDAQPK